IRDFHVTGVQTCALPISAEAGVSSGTFYNYFDTKEAIFNAVIEVTIDRLFAAASIPPDTDPSPLVRIETATRNYLRAYQQHAGQIGRASCREKGRPRCSA